MPGICRLHRIQEPAVIRRVRVAAQELVVADIITRVDLAMSVPLIVIADQPNDLSRSLVALDQNSTIIAVIEMSHSSWLVAGMLPGIERQPRKKLEPSPERLLALLHG